MKETLKMINIRDKIIDIIARIVEQWIAQGDFRIGGYVIRKSEVLDRLHLHDFERVIANEVTEEADANN